MASQSFRNIVSTIAFCDDCTQKVDRATVGKPNKKTVRALLPKVYHACNEAYSMWSGELTDRETLAIKKRLHELEKEVFRGEEMDITIYTSFCLGLLSDIIPHIQDAERAGALETLHAAMLRLHKYYDPKLNKTLVYEFAGKALQVWERSAA